MASRCSCGSSCSCSIVGDGATTTVTGSGSSSDPYVVVAAGGEVTPVVAKVKGDVVLIVGSPSDPVVTGDGALYFTVPATMNGTNITAVHSAVPGGVSSSGLVTVQVARIRSGSGVDVLTTKSTIDASEPTSYTATTPSVVNTANDDLATGDILRVDIDVAGTSAAGLQVIVSFLEP